MLFIFYLFNFIFKIYIHYTKMIDIYRIVSSRNPIERIDEDKINPSIIIEPDKQKNITACCQ